MTVVVLTGLAAAFAAALAYLLGQRQPAPPAAGKAVHRLVPPSRESRRRFRVGSYNIHRGKGLNGKRDLERTAATIADCDIVGLQEVEGPRFGVWPDQSRQLGDRLGIGALFVPSRRRWLRYDRGNGLLCRLPVIDWYIEPLVDSTGRHGRVLATANVRIGDHVVTVLVTHLSRRIDQKIQLDTVLDRFSTCERAILMGDFNVSRSFTTLRRFLASEQGFDAIGHALGDSDAPTRIDWILTRGLRVLNGGRVAEGPSDHPYYWVEIEIE